MSESDDLDPIKKITLFGFKGITRNPNPNKGNKGLLRVLVTPKPKP